jgi:putative Holliday junction resolvase
VGTKRIGVAVSDELRMTVRPLGVIACVSPKHDAKALRAMLDGMRVGLLVIGIPLLDSGEEGDSARRTRAAGLELSRRAQIPAEFVDESDTTLEASRILRESGGTTPIDAMAAALILEAWMARAPGGAD